MRAWQAVAGLVFWERYALTAGDPFWWRLAVNSSDLSQWHFCNLQLFLDRNCLVHVSGIVEHKSSAASVRVLDYSGQGAFVEFASNCADNPCTPMESWVAVRLEEPSVVQCFKYQNCQSVTTTTTTTSSTAAATTSTSAVTTTTSSTSTESTSNPFADLFSGLGRRLSVPGTLVMHRASDFQLDDWSLVASWNAPQPGVVVSITSSTHTLPFGSAPEGSWQPAADLCMRCWDGSGISETSIIRVSFDTKIYFGEGNIEILRGSLPTLTLAARSSPWFKVDTSRQQLQIEPQGEALLGSSGSCLRIRIKDRAILSADGTDYEHDYETCIRDYTPPKFLSSNPANQETGVDLLPKLQISFDQVIRVATDAVATLRAKSAPGGESLPPDQILDLTQARVFTWDRQGSADAGAIEILPSELNPETSYELQILEGMIQDESGNAWEGGTVFFSTTCSIYGCFQATTAAPVQAVEPEVNQGDLAIWLIIVAVLTILCAFGVGIFQLYVRRKVNPSQVHPVDPQKDEVGRSPTVASRVSEATAASTGKETGPSVQWNADASGPLFGDAGAATNPSRPQAHWRKSREAEDIGGSRHVHEETGPRQPYTDDNVGFGRDQSKHEKGTPFNQKVHERHKEPRGHRTHAQPQPPKKEEPPAPALSQNPEVAAILLEVNAQLESTRKEDIASRKKTFKFSCLKWHPDKNADNLEVATEVFQWLQSQRDWYLKE